MFADIVIIHGIALFPIHEYNVNNVLSSGRNPSILLIRGLHYYMHYEKAIEHEKSWHQSMMNIKKYFFFQK